MAEEPSHIKQLSLIHVCKIGLNNVRGGLVGTRDYVPTLPLNEKIGKTKSPENATKLSVNTWLRVCVSDSKLQEKAMQIFTRDL
jgi:hypothetical protein